MKINMQIDWDLLREQQAWLGGFDTPEAIGLEELLSHIQDSAFRTGQASPRDVYGEDWQESLLNVYDQY